MAAQSTALPTLQHRRSHALKQPCMRRVIESKDTIHMWYRIIALMVVLAVTTGCTWTIDESAVFETPAERLRAFDAENRIDEFEQGFANGCMALIYFTAPSPAEVMPFDDALALCESVRQLAGDDRMVPSSAPMVPVVPVEPEIICRGQCI